MLTLRNITKDYAAGDSLVHALRGVDLSFGESEFVCILGPSGCGKTTLLNIIGGLDQYTGGDLVINGRSTREYGDRDWDGYRNHSIGFVFQSYNLIPHQSVLANVELALTLSGVSKAERRAKARAALESVGLGDQLSKRPNQMSGGQMQRVAIARALVNDPDILLADEPTGALDSETSVAIMELLKEIARKKLVIMVTHNPDLAEKYATRTVRVLDGKVISDSASEAAPALPDLRRRKKEATKKPSMSFGTALGLSLNNLMTKKTRTVLTAFAGSIGIIGIALIMSLSNGIQLYIDRVQEDTLSSYPITIEAEAADLSSLITSFTGTASGGDAEEEDTERELDRVYSTTMLYDLLNSLTSVDSKQNDLKSFKRYLDGDEGDIAQYLSAVRYGYDAKFDIYTRDKDDAIVKTDVIELLQGLMGSMYGGDYSSYFSTMGDLYSRYDVWEEMLPGEDGELINPTLREQYDVIYGDWPKAADEVVLIVDKNNKVSDLVLYALGLTTNAEITDAMEKSMNFEQVDVSEESWSYEDICEHGFKLLTPAEYYQKDALTGAYTDLSATATGMDYLYNSKDVGLPLKICGIVRQNEDAVSGMMQGAIGYTTALTERVIASTNESEIVKAQKADPERDVILALPFRTGDEPEPTEQEISAAVREYLAGSSTEKRAEIYSSMMATPSDEYVEALVQQNMEGMTRERIEESMAESYAEQMGVDASTVSGYIADMDDDTLFSYVRDMMAERIRESYGESVRASLASQTAEQLALAMDAAVGVYPDEYPEALRGATTLAAWQYKYIYDEFLPATLSDGSYKDNMELLGVTDMDDPSSINLYAATFKDKDAIADAIEKYNDEAKSEEQEIKYTDYVALLMSSITTIINAISYVLIAFVAISLVVSSIMIGIITYISVLERTKEIGILRAMGASKRDVSNVFNAETLIEGFVSGLIGIGVTLLLLIPINAIVHHYTGIETLNAVLPVYGAVGLIFISMLLTFVAGLIPSGIAAKRDPVEALRTE